LHDAFCRLHDANLCDEKVFVVALKLDGGSYLRDEFFVLRDENFLLRDEILSDEYHFHRAKVYLLQI
ncbi:unnamed protein product, partial [Prunus brigantina]